MSQLHNLIQITDCHINASTRHHRGNTRDMLQSVLAAIHCDESPDLLLVTGDLADDGSEQAYLWLQRQFSRFPCPVLVLPGNHDDSSRMAEVFGTPNQLRDNCRELGEWSIVPLDTRHAGHESGLLSQASLVELDALLTERRDRHILLTLHHYPLPVGSDWLDAMGLVNARQLFAVVDRHPQVRMMLAGHVHQVAEQVYRGIPVLSTPATCRQFLPGSREFALDPTPAGYRRLCLDDNGKVDSSVIRLDQHTWASCLRQD